MPTDWTPSDSCGARRAKTKFYGDPRHTVEVNKFLNRYSGTSRHSKVPSAASNDVYAEGAEEERKEDADHLESEIFDDAMSDKDGEEATETVRRFARNIMLKHDTAENSNLSFRFSINGSRIKLSTSKLFLVYWRRGELMTSEICLKT